MLRSIFAKTMYENRRSLMWWCIAFIAFVVYLLALFPTMRDNPAMQDLAQAKLDVLQCLIGEITSFATPIGYLTGGMFTLMLPLMLIFFSGILGANAIGGEEERNTLDLLLANPVSRTRIVLEKWGAMTALTVLVGVVLLAAFLIGAPTVDLLSEGLTVTNLVAGLTSAVLLALFFGTLALAVGAATGSRALALGVVAGLAGVNYLVKTMAGMSDAMANAQKALPMYYYLTDERNPLREGFIWTNVLMLALGVAVFLGVALATFNRRDVAV